MFLSYLKITLRNLIRSKGYSIINITGLAIGLASCMLMMLWIQDELSFDHFHKNSENIYRVITEDFFSEGNTFSARTPSNVGPELTETFPQIVSYSRFYNNGSWRVERGDLLFLEYNGGFAETAFFEMFSFPFINGNPSTALLDPYSIVLTEETAYKYFGDEDPMNQLLILDGENEFKVTGVIENIPDNSHLKFDFIVPLSIFGEFGFDIDSWNFPRFFTYFQVAEGTDLNELVPEIENIITENNDNTEAIISLQALADIHLYSDFENDLAGHGDIKYVYLFSALALLILITACINFMNLTVALAGRRAKEVGLRKVVGAFKLDLIIQYIGESILLSSISMILALVIVILMLPTFNDLSAKNLTLDLLTNRILILDFILIAIATGILAGGYPAFYLSSFQPAKTLMSSGSIGSRNSTFQKICVITQFSLSIALIITTVVVYQQNAFIQNKELGFNKDHVVFLNIDGQPYLEDQVDILSDQFRNIPGVIAVTQSSQTLSEVTFNARGITWDGSNPDETIDMNFLSLGYDFEEVFGMEFLEGRQFSREHVSDSLGVIINKTAARMLGDKGHVGTQLTIGEDKVEVIGIVKDFHFRSLHQNVDPILIAYIPSSFFRIYLKISSVDINNTLANIDEVRKRVVPDYPLDIQFLDETIDVAYRAEQRLSKLANFATILAIFISCLGLFSMASSSAERRSKEMGVRKVLGATVPSLIILMLKEFFTLILIANVIAWPLAYLISNRWLDNFAYRTELGWQAFVISGCGALVLALFTVSYQAIKAANKNPVETIKCNS
jgi:putative ABC transport system permease protein